MKKNSVKILILTFVLFSGLVYIIKNNSVKFINSEVKIYVDRHHFFVKEKYYINNSSIKSKSKQIAIPIKNAKFKIKTLKYNNKQINCIYRKNSIELKITAHPLSKNLLEVEYVDYDYNNGHHDLMLAVFQNGDKLISKSYFQLILSADTQFTYSNFDFEKVSDKEYELEKVNFESNKNLIVEVEHKNI